MDRQLLARATDSSDAPTPGYLYLDIAKNAASSPTACQEIATYLIRKLQQKSHYNIKFKCCKVMAQLSLSPVTRGQFKRCLAQDANAVSVIKEHLQFRGPPDPARGDEVYERVRVAAKEALDAIYSDTPSSSSLPTNSYEGGGGGASAPYGSGGGGGGGSGMSYNNHSMSGGGGVGGGGGGGPRRMEGIGNPMFPDPRLSQNPHGPATSGAILKEVMREAGQTIVGMIKDPLARSADQRFHSQVGTMPRPGNPSGGYSGGSSGGYGAPPPGRSELVNATGGQWTMASNRGPNSFSSGGGSSGGYPGSNSSYYKARDATSSGANSSFSWAQQQQQQGSTGGVGGSWATTSSSSSTPDYATPSITITSASSSSSASTVPTGHHQHQHHHQPTSTGSTGIVSDGSYERALVLELCPPGGMKAEPPPDKLASFAKAVASLNPDLVCPVLLDCLEEGQPWLIRAKALHVMETCIQHGKKNHNNDDENNPYANFFFACRGEIEPLAHHARSAIREPAKRVLEALGIPVVSEVTATSTAFAHQQQQLQQPSSQQQQQQQHNQYASAAAANNIPNLLDFDDDEDDHHQHLQHHEPVPVPTAPPPASAPPLPTATDSTSSASLFGGLKMQASATSPTAAATTTSTTAAVTSNLFGDLSSPPSTQRASSGGLFGDVVVKQQPPKQPAVAAAATASTTTNTTTTTTEVVSLLDELIISDQRGGGVTQNGSAFGFINQTAVPPPPPPPPSSASTPAAVPPKQSFDPLLNPHVPSPNTARAMMQLSPEQMKAMAYQQMLMQQQLQMAMALQQQQQHPHFLVGPAAAVGGVVRPGMPVVTAPGKVVGGVGGGGVGVGMGGMPMGIMGVNAAAAVANSPFTFLEPNNPNAAKQNDKRFDFVKEAMKSESKK